ncbi:hypothetical protein [Mucilaginibacter sp.]|uniref:hypothetical protein n=1 Tax=Mucilaginibacter sp. TaxID=1882438 RepID=UPI002613FEDE|nr:hypothetical protein [Mucilaginibacter sp.]
MVLKNAPYKFVEFDSIVFQYGDRDSMLNKYNSKTGDYQYLNVKDSLVKMHLHLNQKELLYLHRKAADLGFWDFPADETGDSVKTGPKPPRYVIEFNYKRKSKKVIFDANYYGDPKLVDANQHLIKEIMQVLASEETNQKK